MKKIFILTGEPSGDKLAYKVIAELKKINPEIIYLSVGGENLNSLGIKSYFIDRLFKQSIYMPSMFVFSSIIY
jgi:lipid A disaccharide synthetase